MTKKSTILFLCLATMLAAPLSAQVKDKRNPEASPSLSGHNVALDSRGGAQTIELGDGRGRLRIPFDNLKPAALDDKGRVAVDRSTFLVDWLRQDLPQRFPGVDRVEMVETILSRDTGKELSVSTRRDLELHGELAALASAQKWIVDLLSLRSVQIRMECRFVKRVVVDGKASDVLVELLDDKALLQLKAAFKKPERQLAFLLSEGRHQRRRDLVPRRFLRNVRVETLDSGDIVVPEIKTAFEGFQGSAAAILLPGARELVIDCDFGLGMIARPVPKKTFRLLGQDYQIESPEIVSVRWSSDRIVLGPEEVGFRVSGIVLPYSEDPESPPRTTLDVLVQVQVEPSPKRFVFGTVMGFDDDQGLAFSKVNPAINLQTGRRLSVIRKGRVVGRVEVVEIVGGMTTLKRLKGSVARGDELR